MHKEVLNKNQTELLELVSKFKDDFYLAGGTALALILGHRKSIDFDLFSHSEIDKDKISRNIRSGSYKVDMTLVDSKDEYTVVVKGVKLTFLYYPFDINTENEFDKYIKIPDILTLAAMKAYTLGRRCKWKDYIDLYFILKQFSLNDITSRTKSIFGGEFNDKLFREQLCYFDDVNFSEKVDFLGEPVENNEIMKDLGIAAIS